MQCSTTSCSTISSDWMPKLLYAREDRRGGRRKQNERQKEREDLFNNFSLSWQVFSWLMLFSVLESPPSVTKIIISRLSRGHRRTLRRTLPIDLRQEPPSQWWPETLMKIFYESLSCSTLLGLLVLSFLWDILSPTVFINSCWTVWKCFFFSLIVLIFDSWLNRPEGDTRSRHSLSLIPFQENLWRNFCCLSFDWSSLVLFSVQQHIRLVNWFVIFFGNQWSESMDGGRFIEKTHSAQAYLSVQRDEAEDYVIEQKSVENCSFCYKEAQLLHSYLLILQRNFANKWGIRDHAKKSRMKSRFASSWMKKYFRMTKTGGRLVTKWNFARVSWNASSRRQAVSRVDLESFVQRGIECQAQ